MIGSGFGIVALIPAMLNLTVIGSEKTLAVRICTGDGQIHLVEVPIGKGGQGGQKGLCCAKGCHSGGQRKRLTGKIEPAQ